VVAPTLFPNAMTDIDKRVRIAAFNWLDEQVGIHGDVLPRSILAQGFEFEGQRVTLAASSPEGEPVVHNGLSLCKLHHAAFDKYLLGVTPDYMIEVREDVLEEEDGPMLVHGLQELHQKKIILPLRTELRPNRDFLDRRYQRFRVAD
jgi:HNH endonuclease